MARIRDIVRSLSTSAVAREENRSYTVVVNLRQTSLIDYLLDMGLREHLALVGTQTFSPVDPAHASGACTFVQRDLEDALLYAVPNQPFYLLVGRRLVLRVVPNTDRDGSRTWQMAFCVGPGELRYSEGGTGCVPMPHGRIAVRSLVTEGREHVIFRERPREEHRRVLPFFEIEKGLIEFLQTADNPEGLPGSLFDGFIQNATADTPAWMKGFLDNFYNLDVLGGTLVSDQAFQASWNIAVAASAVAAVACIPTWETDFRGDLPRIDVPVLVVQGDADRVLPFPNTGKRLPGLIKDVQLVVIDGGSHAIAWTHADQVNNALHDFLA
jgi:alpha/beta hydrolase fold